MNLFENIKQSKFFLLFLLLIFGPIFCQEENSKMHDLKKKKVIIIGGGPAGLTAAEKLLKTNEFDVTILEKDNVVGGLSKTTQYKGCKFDIGPHHFITSNKKIEKYWKELMEDQFLSEKRYTRIYYNNHFFRYPLEPINVVSGLSFCQL